MLCIAFNGKFYNTVWNWDLFLFLKKGNSFRATIKSDAILKKSDFIYFTFLHCPSSKELRVVCMVPSLLFVPITSRWRRWRWDDWPQGTQAKQGFELGSCRSKSNSRTTTLSRQLSGGGGGTTAERDCGTEGTQASDSYMLRMDHVMNKISHCN